MSSIDECGVLIPAATLEDFPTDLSDSDARSVLAGWTVLWHPKLLAELEQIPTWYRADSPPAPIGRRILAVPDPSRSQLPAGFEADSNASDQGRLIGGSDREEFLAALELEPLPDLRGAKRPIGVSDFYAAGYAVLQVQVMTRRLRYTSNLDEIHLQSRLVAAAKAFLAGQADDAIAAMHDVFDCLAEERDHYFASDPHLVDLTLMTAATVEDVLDRFASVPAAAADGQVGPDPGSSETGSETTLGSESGSDPLPTPDNLLIDHDVAAAIGEAEPPRRQPLLDALASGAVGWAGGGPPSGLCLDELTFQQAQRVFLDAWQATAAQLGREPTVFARFEGSTPSDLVPTLASLGCRGLIPLDFAGGTGFGDEAKVLFRAGGTELEALTAKPIDAANDAAFLCLGARLGEAIDSGEIATALLVHWPGHVCSSFSDLRRVASWSLALGRFWKLEDYFTEGEQPYHHGSGRAASPDAAAALERRVSEASEPPLSGPAKRFRQAVSDETEVLLEGMAGLVSAVEASDQTLASALGRQHSEQGRASLLINPHSVGSRQNLTLESDLSDGPAHVYAVTRQGRESIATVDVPAVGFAVAEPNGGSGSRFSLAKWVGAGKPKPIAQQHSLTNEFMDITISAQTGGIAGVYSGSSRGNRFSMRLVRGRAESAETSMVCDSLEISDSTSAVGSITTRGKLLDAQEQPTAEFEFVYTLKRGSRMLGVSCTLTPKTELDANPWRDYLAARAAVATESSVFRPLIRDKVHQARGRRLVCPLGVVIDESERQTLVAANGLPNHVRVGERFLDTLLFVRGESEMKLEWHYGFDVPAPVASSRALIAPPRAIHIEPDSSATTLGWLVHTAPKEVMLVGLHAGIREDGARAAVLRVVQTRPRSGSVSLRFVHSVRAAMLITEPLADPLNAEIGEPSAPGVLATQDDHVKLTISGHEVVDLLVTFEP